MQPRIMHKKSHKMIPRKNRACPGGGAKELGHEDFLGFEGIRRRWRPRGLQGFEV